QSLFPCRRKISEISLQTLICKHGENAKISRGGEPQYFTDIAGKRRDMPADHLGQRLSTSGIGQVLDRRQVFDPCLTGSHEHLELVPPSLGTAAAKADG